MDFRSVQRTATLTPLNFLVMRPLAILFTSLFAVSGVIAQTRIEIDVERVRSDQGVIRVAIYADKSEYPDNPFRTCTFEKDSLKEERIKLIICDLPPGDYGFAILDDENRSGRMDYNLLGLPQERFGFGNNVRPFIHTPAYERCVVKIRKGINKMNLILR